MGCYNLAVWQCMGYYRQSCSVVVHVLLQTISRCSGAWVITVLQCGSAWVITDGQSHSAAVHIDQPLILIVDMGLGLWADGPSPSVFFLERDKGRRWSVIGLL